MESKPIFRRRRRRYWRFVLPLLIAALGLAASAAILARGVTSPRAMTGLGQVLDWGSPSDLPGWAKEQINLQIGELDYQIRVAVVDLNRDRQPELLVAPAVGRYDVFVPDSPLRLLYFNSQQWQLSAAELSCRPERLGSFLTNDYWDLPCLTGDGRRILRWDGRHYTTDFKDS